MRRSDLFAAWGTGASAREMQISLAVARVTSEAKTQEAEGGKKRMGKEKGAKKQVVIQPEVTHGGGGLAAVKSDLRGDSYLP